MSFRCFRRDLDRRSSVAGGDDASFRRSSVCSRLSMRVSTLIIAHPASHHSQPGSKACRGDNAGRNATNDRSVTREIPEHQSQATDIDRFRKAIAATRGHGFLSPVALSEIRRYADDRYGTRERLRAQKPRRRYTVHHRHFHVHEHHIGDRRGCHLDALFAILGQLHLVPLQLEKHFHRFAHIALVINQQYAHALSLSENVGHAVSAPTPKDNDNQTKAG